MDDQSDLRNGRPLDYNAATPPQHRNHIHLGIDYKPLVVGLTKGMSTAKRGHGPPRWIHKAWRWQHHLHCHRCRDFHRDLRDAGSWEEFFTRRTKKTDASG